MKEMLIEHDKRISDMNLIQLADYIEALRLSLLCSDVYHDIDEEITHQTDKTAEPLAHMCSALSHLDLADQALRLAHHARFRR